MGINTKRSSTTISPSISGYRYTDADQYDRINASLSASHNYQASELISSSTSGSFNLSDALQFTLEEDGIVANDSRVYDITLGQGLGLTLTKLDSLSFSYSFHPVIHEDSGFADSMGHSFSTSYGRGLTDRSSMSLGAGFSKTYFSSVDGSEFVAAQDSFSQNSYNVNAGYSYALAEMWGLGMSAGVGASSERDTDDLNYNLLGSADLHYTAERYSLSFGFNRSYRQSVLTENVLRTSFRAGLNVKVAKDLNMNLSTSVALSETSTGDSDLSTSVIPSLSFSYQLSENWKTGISYSVSDISSDVSTDETRHRIGLSLTWNFKEQ